MSSSRNDRLTGSEASRYSILIRDELVTIFQHHGGPRATAAGFMNLMLNGIDAMKECCGVSLPSVGKPAMLTC